MPHPLRSIEDLVDAPYNPRSISDHALQGLKESLASFGDISGIVFNVRTGTLVCGHQRFRALRDRYGDKLVFHEEKVEGGVEYWLMTPDGDFPIREVDWPLEKEQAANLAANHPGLQGQFDDGLLEVIEASKVADPDLFERLHLAELYELVPPVVPDEGATDPDAVPDEAEDPVVQSGDLWICGAHRVLCGDATNGEDYAHLLGGEVADLCLTDPPYGVGESYETHDDTQPNLSALVCEFLPLCLKWASVVLLTPGNCNVHLYMSVRVPKWILGWFIPAGSGSTVWGYNCWQPVLAYGPDPYLSSGKGRRPDAFVMTESAENELDHPCPKPVGVWSWVMERGTTVIGQRVLDPFLGSGTTMIAAEKLGRRCYGIEIEPRYVQVAIQRWADFTKGDPVRERDGKRLSEVMKERKEER